MSTHRDAQLAGVDGLKIFWQTWQPASTPRAVVVIAHGAGEHSGRYEHVAARLVQEGYAVYALDHHGHGRSDGPRAMVRRMRSAVSDLDSLITIAAQAHPGADVFLLGHSMGATIALLYAVAHQDRLRGLILSGPLAALPPVPAPVRMLVKAMSAVTPGLPSLAVDATQVSRDPAVVSAYVEDPLVHHGKLPSRTVAEIAAAVESFPAAVEAIKIPTLIAYGTEDGLCPPAGSLMLNERIGAEDKTLKAYEGLYHEILNEPEQETVLDDICGWLSAHLALAAR